VNIEILYEDNHILCAVKPAGILSQADETGAPDMLTLLKAYVKQKYGKSGEAYLGLVHRLDRPVGGAMAFARTSKAAGRLSEQFRSRAVKKTYFAVLDGSPAGDAGLLEHSVAKDRLLNRVSVTPHAGPGKSGKDYASLGYAVLGRADGLTLVRITPHTGRPHQIRAQFAFIGCPVAGDRKYGGNRSDAESLHKSAAESLRQSVSAPTQRQRLAGDIPLSLWSAGLEFVHPVRRTPLAVCAPPPAGYPWSLFDNKYYVLDNERN